MIRMVQMLNLLIRWVVGLEVSFANTNIWSFQTGLNFISKGVKGDGVTDARDVVDVTINQLYLELPLMVWCSETYGQQF